jgi:uncharacterized protein (DUF2267 family)
MVILFSHRPIVGCASDKYRAYRLLRAALYALRDPNADTERIVQEVLGLLAHRISQDEIEEVMHMLPSEV